MSARAWWEELDPGTQWHVLLGTGAPADEIPDAKLAAEVKALPFGYRQALRAIGARLALDPVTDRPAEPTDPERVRITLLDADDHSLSIIARGASVSVIARVHKPAGGPTVAPGLTRIGIVRIIRIIAGP